MKLVVTLESVEFQKANYYYVALHLASEGQNAERHRTDLSAAMKNPQFVANTWDFQLLGDRIDPTDILSFEAYSVAPGNEATLEGECHLDVGQLYVNEAGVRQKLNFMHRSNEQDYSIGTFTILLRLKEVEQDKNDQISKVLPFTDEPNEFLEQPDKLQEYLFNSSQMLQKSMQSIGYPKNTINEIINDKIEDYATIQEKWQVLSKALQQKQELVHRIGKEQEEKTASLQTTGEEIVELRKKISFLKKENELLRRRCEAEDQIQAQTRISKDILNMGIEEVKSRIMTVATQFRDERMRNNDFEKALRESEKEIQRIAVLEQELETLRTRHAAKAKSLSDLQEEISKKPIFEEAIQKQVKVIAKLESVMEATLKDSERAKQSQQQIRQLQQEVDEIRERLREQVYGEHNSDIRALVYENSKLERLKLQLLEELSSRRPDTAGAAAQNVERKYEWEGERIELQVRLNQANARYDALNSEMSSNAKKFANELAQLKLEVAPQNTLKYGCQAKIAFGPIGRYDDIWGAKYIGYHKSKVWISDAETANNFSWSLFNVAKQSQVFLEKDQIQHPRAKTKRCGDFEGDSIANIQIYICYDCLREATKYQRMLEEIDELFSQPQ